MLYMGEWPPRPDKDDRSPGAGVIGIVSCPMYRVLDSNLGPLEEQQGLPTTESSLDPLWVLLFSCFNTLFSL